MGRVTGRFPRFFCISANTILLSALIGSRWAKCYITLVDISYHYTTIEKFQKMLENSISNDDKIHNFKFWASSIYAMNDPMEFVLGFDMLCDTILPQLEKEIRIKDDRYKLSKLWKYYENKSKRLWEKETLGKLYETHQVPFIVSFSKKKDFLPMWTTYANNGNGICLGFSNNDYHVELKGDDANVDIIHYLHAQKVNYLGFDDDIKNTLKRIYTKYYQEYNKADRKHLLGYMMNAFATFSVVSAPYHKHKAYSYEEEERLIQFKTDEADVRYRCSDSGRLIPYIEIPVKKEYLQEVIIGPCADYESVRRELLCEFRKYGINISKDAIIPSEVPFRDY